MIIKLPMAFQAETEIEHLGSLKSGGEKRKQTKKCVSESIVHSTLSSYEEWALVNKLL